MSLRYKGAVISATPPTTTGGESGVASGSWTLEQQFQAQGAGNWPIPFVAKYIEDVFSTYLYTGNGSTQTINNGIDLSTYGGLVWAKMRSNGSATGHVLSDTARGPSQKLDTSSTGASSNWTPYGISAFGSTGFTVADDGAGNYVTNNSGVNYASWTFRKQPKFYTQGTYTGNGVQGRGISHDLGSTPGCIIVKKTSGTGNWVVYHSGAGTSGSVPKYLLLNTTDGAQYYDNTTWSAVPTSTQFFVGTDADVNANGSSYVYYVFASNAGGFGLTGTDNVISCGSYTGNGSTTGPVIDLGYEPQWLLVKQSSASGNDWILVDNMRGFPVTGNTAYLNPNNSFSESSFALVSPTATGFQPRTTDAGYNGNGSTYIYIAIRRGPMKVPTSGTSVFSPQVQTPTGSTSYVMAGSSGFPIDWLPTKQKDTVVDWYQTSRLTNNYMSPNTTAAEGAYTYGFDLMQGVSAQWSTNSTVSYAFRRAPSFFDEVCWTRSTTTATLNHNLGVVPELIIKKDRSRAGTYWEVMPNVSPYDYRYVIYLNDTQAISGPSGSIYWNAAPTATTFDVNMGFDGSSNGDTFVAYLFATCAGVSKVGSYTGTGTTLQVNCGFTGGARFVLIKRTDSTGDWYVWDSARGIVAGNDPYLLLNSTAAEVTNTDYVDTYSAGFEISSTAPAAINASGGTYIFLAIA